MRTDSTLDGSDFFFPPLAALPGWAKLVLALTARAHSRVARSSSLTVVELCHDRSLSMWQMGAGAHYAVLDAIGQAATARLAHVR